MEATIMHAYTNEKITFLETSEQTRGQYLLIQVELPPKQFGPAFICHDDFEKEFQVLTGKLTLFIGKNASKFILDGGDWKWISTKQFHTYCNMHNEPVIFNIRVAPAKKFEQALRIQYGLINDQLASEDGIPITKENKAVLCTMQNSWFLDKPLWYQRLIYKKAVKKHLKKGAYEFLAKYIDNDTP